MSLQTRAPVRVLGGNPTSGSVNDGSLQINTGGQNVYTALSGLGAAAAIASGVAGRLNTVTVTANIVSGQPIYFLDAHMTTSGMPFPTSGHKALHIIPPVWHQSASGVINPAAVAGTVITVNAPFFSGLVAAPLASGTGSFTCSYTLDLSGIYPGQ